MRERRRVPNRNLTNLPSGFPLSDHANFDDFTLLFCRRRRNLHSFKTHLLSYCSAYKTVCFATSSPRCRRRRALLKVLNIKQVLPRIKNPPPLLPHFFNIRDTRKSCFYFRFIHNFFKL